MAVEAAVKGRVTSVSFRDDKNGETIARISPEGNNPSRTSYPFWGNFASSFTRNEIVSITGNWVNHPTYGRTVKVQKIERTPPTTREGEVSYLLGMVQGLTKAQAENLLKQSGGLNGLIKAGKSDPSQIDSWMPRAKIVRARVKKVSWAQQDSGMDVLVGLRSAGLRADQVKALTSFFGGPGLRQIAQQNPYEFCQVPNIGFKTAERVAQFYAKEQGRPFDPFQEDRLIYGLCEAVARERMDGHVCLPPDLVIRTANIFLELPKNQATKDLLDHALGEALSRRLLVKDLDMIYTRGLYKAESDLALQLGKLMASRNHGLLADETEILTELDGQGLSLEQKQAALILLGSPVSILAGGPGRGKTHILKSVIRLFEKASQSVLLLAPTGKAARRVGEMTGRTCLTIHKACGLERDEDVRTTKWRNGQKKRLAYDVVIVDEMSMVDLPLGFELVRRLRAGKTRLILVGDPDQLPPIGAGHVLKDLLASGSVPTARLTKGFRQAKNSPIIKAADDLNSGVLHGFEGKGYELRLFDPTKAKGHPGGQREGAMQVEVDILQKWLLQAISRYGREAGINPMKDIQVYSPQKTGALGIDRLNALLQDHLNPLRGQVLGPKISGGIKVRVGDKVMQAQNNYKVKLAGTEETVPVMNGQIGLVVALGSGGDTITVKYPDVPKPVLYSGSEERSQLAMAYAISIHRSQGSEIPYAFLVIHRSMHPRLINRALIYTAATRAQKGVAFFCSAKDLQQAIQNTDGSQRYTRLAERIKQSSKRLVK